ncbi:MAG: hypothetical protein K9W44_10610 [Candidatus Lokiarchaeota archaeon]|nr:hypothetical protein [Candidatus Harpocratesius repetitus]
MAQFGRNLRIIITILVILIIILSDLFMKIPIFHPNWLYVLFIPISYTGAQIAAKIAVYPHSFKKHPVCYLGQTNVFNQPNTRAMYVVQVFFLGFASMFYFIAAILRNYFSFNPYLQATAFVLYICVVLVILMGIIPINESRPQHLMVTFTLFGLHYAITIIITAYFLYMQRYSVFVSIMVYIGGIIHLIGASLYLIAYIIQKKASLFQNFWFIGSFIGLLAQIEGLIQIITYL